MDDLVSVLMCVYNTPIDYLREAVNSILCQTYNNIEFVIVDDSSSDKDVIQYLNVVNSQDERIVLIHNGCNLGLTKSLNIGLNCCKGKYIARMDSDDISLPFRIKKQVDFLNKNLDVALVGSSIFAFGVGLEERDGSDRVDRCDDPDIYKICSLIQHSGPPHPTFMFRASFLKDNDIKYREDILKAQDYAIIVDILKAGGEIRRLKEPLLKYRIHGGQITNQSEIDQKAYQWRISFDYLGRIFPDLDKFDCAAVALLGYDYDYRELLKIVMKDAELKTVCSFLVEYGKHFEKSRRYINAVKRILKQNNKMHYFDDTKLESELRYRLWKKACRTSEIYGHIWGMWPYTLLSYIFVMREDQK